MAQEHSGSVTGIGVQQLADGSLLLVSTSADDDVVVWTNDAHVEGQGPSYVAQARWRLCQRIAMPLRLQHAIAITSLPNLADWWDPAVLGLEFGHGEVGGDRFA